MKLVKSGSGEAAELAGVEIAGGELLAAAADAKVHRGAGEAGALSGIRQHGGDGFEFLAGFRVPVDDAVLDGGDGLATGSRGTKSVDLFVGDAFGAHQGGE